MKYGFRMLDEIQDPFIHDAIQEIIADLAKNQAKRVKEDQDRRSVHKRLLHDAAGDPERERVALEVISTTAPKDVRHLDLAVARRTLVQERRRAAQERVKRFGKLLARA